MMTTPSDSSARHAVDELRELLFARAGDGEYLELLVKTGSSDLPLRDLAAYLQLIDHLYGRLQEGGLRAYARRPDELLRADEVRAGSVEVVVTELLQAAPPLAMVWLCLRLLPRAIESLATAYERVEQGRLTGEQRLELRRRLEAESGLEGLSDQGAEELAVLVAELLARDQALIPKAQRFAADHVVAVELRLVPGDERQSAAGGVEHKGAAGGRGDD